MQTRRGGVRDAANVMSFRLVYLRWVHRPLLSWALLGWDS